MARPFALLRRIVGRLKKYMNAAILAFSLMLVPLGYYLAIEGPTSHAQMGGYLSIVIGIVLFMVACLKGLEVERKRDESDKNRFDELMKEIKGLRQDLTNERESRNERTSTDT